jgi:methylmalonyl-CoA mutase C-terminal domain/subunit
MSAPSPAAAVPVAARKAPRRVLLGKPGLDGHERGVLVIARALRDAGHEVIYTGIRQRPAAIAQTAIQEDVDVIGLSILSGSHMVLVAAVLRALADADGADIPVIVGGTIPADDGPRLTDLGVAAVFGVGSRLDDILAWMERA